MPTAVASFKAVASLLEEWKKSARKAEQFELCEIAGLASWRVWGCAEELKSQEISVKDMERQVGVIAVNDSAQKTHAIAVWRILSCGVMQLDFLATHLDKVNQGASSAAIEYLKAQAKKIRLTATPSSVSFYEKHGFSLEEDSQVFMIFSK